MLSIPRGPIDAWGLRWALSYEPDGRRSARVWCPLGHGTWLDVHAIASDGTVTPAVICPDDHCTWIADVCLIGW